MEDTKNLVPRACAWPSDPTELRNLLTDLEKSFLAHENLPAVKTALTALLLNPKSSADTKFKCYIWLAGVEFRDDETIDLARRHIRSAKEQLDIVIEERECNKMYRGIDEITREIREQRQRVEEVNRKKRKRADEDG